MSKEVTPQILGLNGRPIPPSTAQLRERVELMNSLISGRRQHLVNSLEGLAARLGSSMNQDNITSMLPLFTSNMYAPLTSNYTLLTYLWKTHGVLQTMTDEPVEDAGFDDLILSSKEVGEGSVGKDGLGELEDFATETGVWERFKSFIKWGRLYGGSGLIINMGQDPEVPLDPRTLRKGNLEFYAADRWQFPGAFRSAKRFLFNGRQLDASNVLTFAGKEAPYLIRNQLAGWGMSEMERTAEDFNVWLRGRNVLYEILNEAKIDVYSIKNFASTLALPDGEQTLMARFQAVNAIKNFHSALVLDSEDEYKVVTNSFGGLAEVMRENRIGIACATRIPFLKLFGTVASGGLSNSSEEEMKNYYGLVNSTIRGPARPLIRKVLRLMMYAVWGKEYDISFEYKPQAVLSADKEEEVKRSKQTRFTDLYDKRIIDSKELGDLLHKEKLVPIETKAQQGLLPPNPEVPTTEDMFSPTSTSKGEGNGKGDADGEGSGEAGGEPNAP